METLKYGHEPTCKCGHIQDGHTPEGYCLVPGCACDEGDPSEGADAMDDFMVEYLEDET